MPAAALRSKLGRLSIRQGQVKGQSTRTGVRGDPEVIPKSCDIYPCPVASQKPAFLLIEMVRPGGFELPAFWFVANGIKLLNALFGVAYELETPFFPQLAAPNVAPKTEFRSNFYSTVHKLNPKSQVRLGRTDFES